MLPGILETPEDYSFLYFLKVEAVDENARDLAEYVADLSADKQTVCGFDRLLWSYLSSGQMPSELYTFNFYGSSHACEIREAVLVVFSKIQLKNLPQYLAVVFEEKLETLSVNDGAIAEPFEEDDEFANCYYGSLLLWESLDGNYSIVNEVRNLFFSERVQLMVGKTLYSIDEWVEEYFNTPEFNSLNQVAGAVHLLFPDNSKIEELTEAVADREKAHIDPEIKGIYC